MSLLSPDYLSAERKMFIGYKSYFSHIYFFIPTFKQLIQLIFTNSLLSNAILGLRKWREIKTGWEIEKKTKKQTKLKRNRAEKKLERIEKEDFIIKLEGKDEEF